MTHEVTAVQADDDHCYPDVPAPTPQQEEPCTGQIAGTITMECCCPRLYTRTFVVQLSPSTVGAAGGTIQATVNAWEGAGYLVLAHALTDVGGGWLLTLTIGWYA